MEWTTERPNNDGWYFYQVVDANGDEDPIRVGYIHTTVPSVLTAIIWPKYNFVVNMEDDAKEANAVLRWAGPIAEPTSITG